MNEIVKTYQSIPAGVLPLIAGAIGLSALQQKVKNWLELEDPKVLVLLTTTFSLAAAIIPAALGMLSASPAAIGTHTAEVIAVMTLAYRYVVQPASNKLSAFQSDVADAKAARAAKQATADGVIVAAPTPAEETPATPNANVFNG